MPNQLSSRPKRARTFFAHGTTEGPIPGIRQFSCSVRFLLCCSNYFITIMVTVSGLRLYEGEGEGSMKVKVKVKVKVKGLSCELHPMSDCSPSPCQPFGHLEEILRHSLADSGVPNAE